MAVAVITLDYPFGSGPTTRRRWRGKMISSDSILHYWLRHLRPDYTEEFANAIDADIRKLLQACIGMNIDSWSDVAKERMRLPI
jgi:hypothetical protein